MTPLVIFGTSVCAGVVAVAPMFVMLWRRLAVRLDDTGYKLWVKGMEAESLAAERDRLTAAHNYACARIVERNDHIATLEPLANIGRRTIAHRAKQDAARKAARAGRVTHG